jgi:predicted TIM-barrel fold metal-dependent hydrolase
MSHVARRSFLAAGVTSLVHFVKQPLAASEIADTRRSIFDAHLHAPSENGQVFQWNLVTRDMPAFVAYLDKCNVRRGVISATRSTQARTPEEYRAGNREVIKYAERYKDRFRPSAVVSPMHVDDACREIEECVTQLGFRWLGEFCNYMTGYSYDTPEWAQIMKTAAKVNAVIQIHTDAKEMAMIAERYPENTIVFPHLGARQPEIAARIDIVAKHKNCSIDISGSGIERVGILEKAVQEIGSERVLYGSDFTINEPSAVITRVENAFLTPQDRENIMFRNVERLLAAAGPRRG